jgi:arylsulfatase A-like enzyme
MHVPLIWRHAGKIPAGLCSDALVSNYDFLPSLLDYVGLADKQAADPPSPGRSYAAELRGTRSMEWENVVYFEFETVRAIRTDRWKYIVRHGDGPGELYDLAADAGERSNLIDAAEHAALRGDLHQRLTDFFARYADPKYDLWRGGRSKAARMKGAKAKMP